MAMRTVPRGWSQAGELSLFPFPCLLQVGGAPTSVWRTSSHWAASSVTPCSTSATPHPPRFGSDLAQGALVPRGCGDTGTVLQLQQCLAEADALLRQQMGREPGSGGSWSDVSPSELESRYVTPCHPMSPRGATGGCRWFFPPAAPAALTAPCPTGSQMASTALTRQ